uniref:Uncharacterized protein n=1 Tax=Callorhinchus milii TaxID=7868 RepID=A0A4W3J790_CALMI
ASVFPNKSSLCSVWRQINGTLGTICCSISCLIAFNSFCNLSNSEVTILLNFILKLFLQCINITLNWATPLGPLCLFL